MATTNEQPDLKLQRRLVAVGVVGSALFFWRGAEDVFGAPKLTIVALAAVGVVAVSIWRALERGQVAVPRGAVVNAIGAFLVAGLVAVVMSPSTWRSLYGQYERAGGYLLYLCSAVLFVGVVRAVDERSAPRLVRAVAIGGFAVALYGLLQRVGLDPFEWGTTFAPKTSFSTIGNTNFVSGYLAAMLPLGAWLAWHEPPGWRRWMAIAGTVAVAAGIVATRSAQGLVAGAMGVGIAAAALLVRELPDRRRQLMTGIAAVAVAGGLLLALGLSGRGPLGGFNDAGVDFRRDYWAAALHMVEDRPITGVGFDMWAGYYRAERSPEAAAEVTLTNVTDEPHSVPLGMFAGGGLLLGLTYVAIVLATASTLLRGLLRAEGSQLLLLAAVGGAWSAYLVQSAVSIDVPMMPPLHFVLAGLIVVLAGAARSEVVEIPPLVAPVHVPRHGQRRRSQPVRARVRTSGRPALVVAIVIALVGLWQVSRPLRAELAVDSASGRDAAGDPRALADLRRAADLVPWEPEYRSRIAAGFLRAQQPEFAVGLYERALELDERSFENTLNAARAAAASESPKAASLYRRALELEPHAPELKAEAGHHFAGTVDVEEGVALIEEALAVRPDGPLDWRLWLGEALLLDGETAEGRGVLDEARESLPPLEVGAFRLDELDIYLRAELVDEARELAEQLLEENPENLPAKERLARILESEGENAAAATLWEELYAADGLNYAHAAQRAANLRAEGDA